jgi:c-di-GMP-binding flagellar brake protein YcgR
MVCSLLLPDSNPYRFPVLNVSQTGFSLLDENRLIADSIRIGGILQTCQFSWPRTLDDLFTAELRRTTEVKNAHGILGSAILGLRFVKTTRDFDKQMQDLLHALTRERKRRSELAQQRPAAEALCA